MHLLKMIFFKSTFIYFLIGHNILLRQKIGHNTIIYDVTLKGLERYIKNIC